MKILAWDVADDGGTIFGLYSVSGRNADLKLKLEEVRKKNQLHLGPGVLAEREPMFGTMFAVFRRAEKIKPLISSIQEDEATCVNCQLLMKHCDCDK